MLCHQQSDRFGPEKREERRKKEVMKGKETSTITETAVGKELAHNITLAWKNE